MMAEVWGRLSWGPDIFDCFIDIDVVRHDRTRWQVVAVIGNDTITVEPEVRIYDRRGYRLNGYDELSPVTVTDYDADDYEYVPDYIDDYVDGYDIYGGRGQDDYSDVDDSDFRCDRDDHGSDNDNDNDDYDYDYDYDDDDVDREEKEDERERQKALMLIPWPPDVADAIKRWEQLAHASMVTHKMTGEFITPTFEMLNPHSKPRGDRCYGES